MLPNSLRVSIIRVIERDEPVGCPGKVTGNIRVSILVDCDRGRRMGSVDDADSVLYTAFRDGLRDRPCNGQEFGSLLCRDVDRDHRCQS